jgi:hypothetical protein
MRNMLKIVRFMVNKVMELINDTIQYLCYKNNFFHIFFKRLKNIYCSTYKILYDGLQIIVQLTEMSLV